MTPTEAAKLLELSDHATPEQIEARFQELRAKLEDKIAKAPTPGLKAKYRESLDEITLAFETLTLTADSSSLPVLRKETGGGRPETGGPSFAKATDGRQETDSGFRSQVSGLPAAKRKSGSKEFLIVAVIAVAVLGAGGWWVMKTRAGNAEKARIAAEAKAEQVRVAAVAETAALQKKQEEAAEAGRLNTLKTALRTKLAEARVEWEALESGRQDAERRTSELKGELRSLRDAPPAKKAELSAQVTAQELHTKWLKDYLLRHPAKLARVRAEELLQSGATDEAAAATEEIFAHLEQTTQVIADRRTYFFDSSTDLRLHSKPEGVRWILTDAYGRTREGTTPAQMEGLPLTHLVTDGIPVAPFAGVEQRGEFTTGTISVRFLRPGWPEVVRSTTALLHDNPILEAEFPEGSLAVTSQPAGATFTASNALGWSVTGKTPTTLRAVPPGSVSVRLSRPGYRDVSGQAEVAAGQTPVIQLDHRSQTVRISVAEPATAIFVDGEFAGRKEATLVDLAPGEHALQLDLAGYAPYRARFTVKQESGPQSQTYSFAQLSAETMICKKCNGAGRVPIWFRCDYCSGTRFVNGDYCKSCSGKGQVQDTSGCSTCGGDGRVSQLDLAR